MKCKVIPIVIGGLGCVTAMLDVHLQKFGITQLCTLDLLQYTVVLGSSYILLSVGSLGPIMRLLTIYLVGSRHVLAQSCYKKHHDAVAQIVHWELAKEMD